MGREVDIPWIVGINIPWIGVDIPWKGGQYTMGRGFDIPCVEGIDITWVGTRYTMYRVVKMPWVGRSIYHG